MKSRTMFNSKKLTVGLLIIYLAVLTWIMALSIKVCKFFKKLDK